MSTVTTNNDPPAPVTASPAHRLTGTLSTFDIVFTVLAFNAPLAIVVGYIPVIIGFGNGLGAPVAFFGVGLLILLFAVGFTTMGRHLPNPGAFYSYVAAGLGKPLGLGASFLAVVSYLGILVGVYTFAGLSLASLVTDVLGGPDIAWWVYALAVTVLVGVLGYFRISLSAKVLTAFMVLEMIIIVIFNVVTFATGGAEGVTFAPFTPDAALSGSVGLAVLFAFACFGGFEATAIFREEARDPQRTIPRATYIAVLVLGVTYGISAWAIIVATGASSVVDATAADPAGTVIASIGMVLGKTVMDIVTVLLVTSLFAAALSTHNVSTRYMYSLSVDRILPAALGRVHVSHGSPHMASLAASGIAIVVLVLEVISNLDPTMLYIGLSGIGCYGLLLLMLLTSIAVVIYFARNRGRESSMWKSRIAPAIATLGLALAVVIGTSNIDLLVGGNVVLTAILLVIYYGSLVAGFILAVIYRRTRPDVYALIGRQD